MTWFGIIQLTGLVVGWVGTFVFLGYSLGSMTSASLGPSPTPSQVSAAIGPLLSRISLLIPLEVAVDIAGVLLLVVAFRQLKGIDGRFSVPSILTILLAVGGALVAAGFVGFFSQLPSLISQSSISSGTTIPPELTSTLFSFIAYLLVLIVGGILTFVGLIGGQILGLWRLGSKYNETTLKIGAIFAIIPLLNFVAPVLVIVGSHQADSRISAS